MKRLIFLVITLNCAIHKTFQHGSVGLVPNPKFHFPPGSGMGFFLALAVPLDLPNKSVFLAYNFQAHYPLPGDETFLDYPPLLGRKGSGPGSIDRKLVYDMLESKIEAAGLSGKECMLRTICEASSMTVENNGILGDLLHIVLSPSTTNNPEGFSKDYIEAETIGKEKDCQEYNKNCTVSFLDVVSWIGHAI